MRLNMKKLAKLLDRLDGDDFTLLTKGFTLLFEKLIYFKINIEKAPTIPIYKWVSDALKCSRYNQHKKILKN